MSSLESGFYSDMFSLLPKSLIRIEIDSSEMAKHHFDNAISSIQRISARMLEDNHNNPTHESGVAATETFRKVTALKKERDKGIPLQRSLVLFDGKAILPLPATRSR